MNTVLKAPYRCDRHPCPNDVPEERLEHARRANSSEAYCSEPCRINERTRRYRDAHPDCQRKSRRRWNKRISGPVICSAETCENVVPEDRVIRAYRTGSDDAYCSDPCRAATQQRRYRARKRKKIAA